MKNPFGQGSAQRRFLPLCLLLFVLSLVVGFMTGFPNDVLRDRLVQEITTQTGLQASSESLELGFPAKLEFDLTIDPNHGQAAPLVFEQVQVRPLWTTLFSKARSAALQGRFAEGDFEALVSADSRVQLDADGVHLAPLQKQGNPYRFDGVLQATFDGVQMSRPGSADGTFSAEINGLVVFGLEAFGLTERLALGQLSLQGALRGQRLTFEKVTLAGDFAGLNGSGTVQIGPTPRQTRLNLSVTAKPGAAFPDSLKPLIELSGLKPKANGSYQFRVTGSLARPVVR